MATKKPTSKATPKSKTLPKTAAKAVKAKKPIAKKSVTKKPAAKPTAAKKTATKKPVTPKVSATKTPPKATSVKTSAPKKTTPKATATKKVQKPAPAKATTKKPEAKKPAPKAAPKAAPKKTNAKIEDKKPKAKVAAKAPAKKAPSKRPPTKASVAKAFKEAIKAQPRVFKKENLTTKSAIKSANTSKETKPVEVKKPEAKVAPKLSVISDKKVSQGFRVNEYIVYPAHGVGQITEISTSEIAGITLELFVIHFEKEKMTLRVPLEKAKMNGMRKLADKDMLENALKTLRGRARIKRTMWSRRAQEYEAKINSGDIIAISEVVRDLYRNENQPEQSYSERQLYEAALERLAREYGTIRKITDGEAIIELESILAKTTGTTSKADDSEETE